MQRTSETALSRLRAHVYPFTHFSDQAARMAEQTLRIYCLSEGEGLHFPARPSDDFLFLVSGEVAAQRGDISQPAMANSLDAEQTPIRLPLTGDALRLDARAETVICRGHSQMIDDFLALDELGRTADATQKSDRASDLLLRLRDTETFRNLPLETAFYRLATHAEIAGLCRAGHYPPVRRRRCLLPDRNRSGRGLARPSGR